MEWQLKIETPINILVQRRAAIGDVIMSTGVVRELKKKYGPNANIDVATDCAEVYRNNPHIRNIFPVDQIPDIRGWDIVVNLDNAYELNPTKHYIKNYFYRAFAENNLNQQVELFPTDEDKLIVADFQKANELDKYIVVHMRNWYWAAKNISMDVWFDVYAKLFEYRTDFKIVCVGGPTDHVVEHPLFVDARNKFNNQQLMHLCEGADTFVGVDSGPYWCAAASQTHIIALLTHLRPEVILPVRDSEYSKNAVAIQTLEDCRGCNDEQVRPVSRLACKKGTTPCNNNFDTAAIASAILDTL
jgi:ADP-heptose:LPS heptosyltransferase